ncbi:MAG: TraR/DksA family transcriptional regulator [Acidimicrobiia bacterium]
MSSNVANLEQRLRSELDQATAQLARLEQQYEELLHDPGVLQEDRDATRMLLEAARDVEAAARGAVSRFADGTYGRCVRCGEEIAPERLEALPDVDTCVTCAGKALSG